MVNGHVRKRDWATRNGGTAVMLNLLSDADLYAKLRQAANMWFRRTEQLALEELIKRYELAKQGKAK